MGSPELKIFESSGRWMDYVGSPELKICENHGRWRDYMGSPELKVSLSSCMDKAFIKLCFGAITVILVVIDWKMCQGRGLKVSTNRDVGWPCIERSP